MALIRKIQLLLFLGAMEIANIVEEKNDP